MEFIDFKRAVYKQFDALANNADRLYLTNVNKDELWDIDSYPEDERQSHTCRQFIKPYGNVVAIVNNKLVSIWDSLVLDEPNGLIGTTGKSFTADKLKRSINAAITGRFNAITRRYGLRQQVLYLMYYGIE